MTPIFFPFTYMPEPTAAALSAVFRRVGLYRPSETPLPETVQRHADAGFLEIRTPVGGDEDGLRRAAADYRAWAERHSGSPLAFFKSQQGQIPFFEESSLSRIRSDIKRGAGERTDDASADPVFGARLFLSVAQDFDREQWEVNRGFADLRDLEASLLKSIHGEQEAGGPSATAPVEDLGRHMTDRRLWAWSCLWAGDPAADALLVTDSREIFDVCLEPLFDSPALERFDIDWPVETAARKRRDDLLQFLEDLSAGKTDPPAAPALPDETGNRMALHLFRANGMGPLDVMSGAAGGDILPHPDLQKEKYPSNTVVIHVDYLR